MAGILLLRHATGQQGRGNLYRYRRNSCRSLYLMGQQNHVAHKAYDSADASLSDAQISFRRGSPLCGYLGNGTKNVRTAVRDRDVGDDPSVVKVLVLLARGSQIIPKGALLLMVPARS